nr:cytochrome P450 9e2-like [Onthophagus taurus]
MFLIIFVITSLILIYIKLTNLYSTWTKKGIKQTKPLFLLGDNAGTILGSQSVYDSMKNLYNSFPNERYFGMYQLTLPTIQVNDPDLIKTIAIKDFDHFVNHRQFLPGGVEPMWTKNLLSMQNSDWKHMRTTLTPSFTSNKMKSIFNLISEVSQNYVEHFKINKHINEIELKNFSTRYTNDVIASVAFGIQCDSLKYPENDFFVAASNITNGKGLRLFAFLGYIIFPRLFKMLNIPAFSRSATNFLKNAVLETIKTREKHNIVRPDMIHLLMEMKNDSKSTQIGFSDEDIAAQAFIFYLGGFETVSATIFLLGHCLSTHPNVQRKLQKEIDDTLKDCNGKLTYEALLKMKYLDMVISETLRMWPSLPNTDRVCTKPYTLPPSNEKGKPLDIYPGQPIIFPIMAMHYDPKYFPNPNEWDPERFSDENREKIHPYAYLPFGIGPRNCIGSRLAQLEIKIFYFNLLSQFNLVKTDKTVIPLQLHKRSFNMNTQHDIWVGVKERI